MLQDLRKQQNKKSKVWLPKYLKPPDAELQQEVDDIDRQIDEQRKNAAAAVEMGDERGEETANKAIAALQREKKTVSQIRDATSVIEWPRIPGVPSLAGAFAEFMPGWGGPWFWFLLGSGFCFAVLMASE